jgi:tetratricopeptide (TPR) repeat protein
MTKSRIAGALLAAGALFLTAADVLPVEDRLWEHRNLGKAFYENPDTHVQAVTELREALHLKPDSVRDRINYGLALLRAGQTDEGVAELLQAQKQDPANPHTWFNLGIAYKHAGDYDKAIEQLRGMIRLVPGEAVAHYNLASVLRSKGDSEAALPEFLEAERLNPNLAGPHFQLFSLYQRAQKRAEAAKERQEFEDIKKRTEGAPVPEDMEWCFYVELDDPPEPRSSAAEEPTRYDDKVVSKGWPAAAHVLAIDTEGLGRPDLLVWSRDRVELLRHGVDLAGNSGIADLKDVISIAAGDYDNDGLPDLCVVTGKGVALFHNVKGAFAKASDLAVNSGFSKAVWLDFDHDNDLDLLLFGPNPALYRNIGGGKFEEKSALFPFVKGNALDAALTAIRIDTAARDLIVSYQDRAAVLYRDRLNGVFDASDLAALPAGSNDLEAEDFNHDGLLDIVSYQPAMLALRNAGDGFVRDEKAKPPRFGARTDFNGDKREDVAAISSDGNVVLALNASPAERWLSVRLQGVKNLKTAPGATVEMKAGGDYEKKVYSGVPLAFAVDGHTDADTIRITWPNGLIQNEPHQKLEALTIPEAQRLSGSCPMIFTWDGEKYEFITDVLGVAPLGASSGDGDYFPVDHDEYIQIPGPALKAQNGKYKLQITEELHEVSYLDQVQLIAVDHPAGTAIYTNDKFKSPPYPEFRLFGAAEKIHPLRAFDGHGLDVTARVAKVDQTYPDAFERDASGVAELHTLELDFGTAAPDNRAALILSGWVDWADGSTFLRAAQTGHGLVFPYLQVKNSAGRWQTVVQDMGIPSGKPKTMAVDLTGKFLSSSRAIRIVTNLCVYWDEIFLIPDARSPRARLTALNAVTGDLHFRGFSRAVVDPARRQPERFLYSDVRPISNWNPTPGMYTRYGDVAPLLQSADDRMAIMGSGDEVTIEYPAASLPALPAGWTRDFLLKVDGWAKDADANTAFSQTVLPLPFHAMSGYPYKPLEYFPQDKEHAAYVRDYLTRPALRLIRPLAPAKATE